MRKPTTTSFSSTFTKHFKRDCPKPITMQNKRIIFLSLILFTSFLSHAQGILGRRTLGNLNVNTLKESDINSSVSNIDISQLSKLQQSELMKQRLLEAENFQQLRSRLPEAIAKDSGSLKDYVKRNIFRDTLIFGSELFKQGDLDFAPNLQLANTPNYIVGSGDKINLTIYGVQEATYDLEVGANGTLTVPYLGVVHASGMTLAALETKLKQKLIFAGYPGINSGQTKIALNVTDVRTIQITVVGALKPGNYSLPSVATAMHALYAAGGPGNLGSYRNIEILRNGKAVAHMDLYDLLITGQLPNNTVLEEGDVVFIPVYTNRVNMLGEFKRPGLYEAKTGEDLDRMIVYAGGFSEGAFKDQLIIFSTGETELKISDAKQSEFSNLGIHSGDVILALPLRNRYENKLAITGSVVRPGFYAWSEGQTFQELLMRSNGFDRGALKSKAVLIRRPENSLGQYIEFNPENDNPLLQPNDSVYVGMMSDFLPYDSVAVRGYVKQPGRLLFRPGLTLEQAILLSGGITPEGNIRAIEVSNPRFDENGELTGEHLVEVISPDFQATGKALQPGATISVRSRKNLNTSRVVYFQGAVQSPGGYALTKDGESLGEVYSRVGGLSNDAMPNFGMVIRQNPNVEFKEIELYVKKNQVLVEDSVRYLSEEYEPLQIIPKDTIAVDFTKASDVRNFGLQEGDTVYIPRQLNVVYVRGNVKNQGGHAYKEGRRAKFYLNAAGGLRTRARTRDVVVEYANGRSAEVKYFLGIYPIFPRVYSNSTITVQDRPKQKSEINPAEWSALTSSLASLSSITLGIIYLLRP